MKRSIFIVLLFCSIIGYSQNIRFMGIPLGISHTSFKKQLLSKDFTYDSEKSNNVKFNNIYVYHGKFSGEVAGLSVMVTPKSKIVYGVNVRFKGYSGYSLDVSEDSQDYKFEEIKQSISKKYCDAEQYDWSGTEIYKATTWQTPEWRIDLYIHHYRDGWRSIDLTYTDLIAQKKNNQEAESDF